MVQGDLRGYLPNEGIQNPEFQRPSVRNLADQLFSVEYLSEERETSSALQGTSAIASISMSASLGSLATSTVDLAGGEDGK